MSRFNPRFSLGLVVVLATVLSAAGYASAKGGGGHGGGGHGGGGHGGGHGHGGMHVARGHGGGHFARAHVGGGGHVARAAVSGAIGRSAFPVNRAFAVSNARAMRAFNARGIGGALHNPLVRAQLAAGLALAPWGAARAANIGWWQHGNGGYGWAGPVFWPFAYHDIYDYALWGSGYGGSFWYYGYDDIYAGIFAPYGYSDLTGYFPRYAALYPQRRRGSRPPVGDQLALMCGADSADILGLPVDQIQQLIQLNDAQRAALEQLVSASTNAAQGIRSACPTDVALTAPARLANMQQRIEAMIAAVNALQPPLQKFYDGLSDEQRAQFSALMEPQRSSPRQARLPAAPVQDCGVAQPGVMDWPDAEVDRKVRPSEAQRADLLVLHDAAAKAAEMLKTCQPERALTLSARLAAVGDRLNVMLDAVKTVRAALDQFYGSLTDEQKAQFETIRRPA